MTPLFQIFRKQVSLYGLLLFIVIGFADCNSAKQVPYFQDLADTVDIVKRVPTTEYKEVTISKGDVLNIEVTTIDAKIGGIENSEQAAENGKSSKAVSGYMVDKNGDIELPILGKMRVEGLTILEIKDVVTTSALKFYKDPLVNVRIANFYITVLGEVRAPGRYTVNSAKINIIDAIGLAGDLTLGGKRGNVIIIREEKGESVLTRVSLNTTDLFQSKYFYLQSGDKLYIEPLKTVAKLGTSNKNVDRIISLALATISMAIAVTSLLIR